MARFDQAVVLGGSVAGLLTAAALSPSFGRVTIVDRDELPVDGPAARAPRRGVPHGTQVHHLLSLGQRKIEALLPGLSAELTALGCETYDDVADFSQYVGGAWRMRVKSDLTVTVFRRPAFEWAIRRRVLALGNVTAVQGVATGLVASAGGASVTGARVRGAGAGSGAEDRVAGDLVVDCTGRRSRAPAWIADLGYQPPAEQHVRIYLGYSTFTARIPAGALPRGLAGISVSATPGSPMGAAIRPCGNGLHDVTAYGMIRHYPPDDFDRMLALLGTLDSPLIASVLREATITSEIEPYRMNGNQRRLWERLGRRPERFVVAGDAVTSFNPIYGQGMTMAALDAAILGDIVAEAETLDGVAGAAQQAFGPLADVAWDLAVGLDSAYPEAEYDNVAPPSARDRAWSRAFAAAQTTEPLVRVAARATALYMDTAYRDAPAVRAIVAGWAESGRRPGFASTRSDDPPGVSDGYVSAQDLLGPGLSSEIRGQQ
jgi:2-polyprenyl-6-methoxyphenol hydroxylase-like FAD-dependent oxidoreductase